MVVVNRKVAQYKFLKLMTLTWMEQSAARLLQYLDAEELFGLTPIVVYDTVGLYCCGKLSG